MNQISTRILPVLGVLAYLAFLVLQFPVTRILTWLEPLPGQTQVYSAGGTVLNGNAALIQWHDWQFESITWDLRPWALLSGRLEFDVTFHNHDESRGLTQAGITILRQPYLANLHAKLLISALEPLWRPAAINLGGWIKVDLDHLNLSTIDPEVIGQIILENVTWEGKSPLPIGDFLVALDTISGGITDSDSEKLGTRGNSKGEATKNNNNTNTVETSPPVNSESDRIVRGQITDRSGPVQVQGQIQLDRQWAWQLTGNIGLRPNTPVQIRQILSFLGAPDQNGRFPIHFNGRLN